MDRRNGNIFRPQTTQGDKALATPVAAPEAAPHQPSAGSAKHAYYIGIRIIFLDCTAANTACGLAPYELDQTAASSIFFFFDFRPRPLPGLGRSYRMVSP